MNLDNCPHCNANLIGDPIPPEIAPHYSGTHWRLDIGIEYPKKYDGIWEYMCPECGGKWPSEVQKLRTKEKAKT